MSNWGRQQQFLLLWAQTHYKTNLIFHDSIFWAGVGRNLRNYLAPTHHFQEEIKDSSKVKSGVRQSRFAVKSLTLHSKLMLSPQVIPQEVAAWDHLAILHLLGTNPTPPAPPRKWFWYPFIWIEVSLTSSSMSYRTACTHPWSRKHIVSRCITAQTPRLPVLEREGTAILRGWLLFANTIHSHCWVTHGGTVAPEWGKVNAPLALSALCQVTFEVSWSQRNTWAGEISSSLR